MFPLDEFELVTRKQSQKFCCDLKLYTVIKRGKYKSFSVLLNLQSAWVDSLRLADDCCMIGHGRQVNSGSIKMKLFAQYFSSLSEF